MCRAASLIVVLGALVLGAPTQVVSSQLVLPSDSLVGRDSFEFHCASCHGRAGLGDGPLASELKTRPADLTTLARRNGGVFPRDAVRAFVTGTGRTVAAHGPTEMPIWGPLFRAFESDARGRRRIENLVTHIESIQAPSTGRGTESAK